VAGEAFEVVFFKVLGDEGGELVDERPLPGDEFIAGREFVEPRPIFALDGESETDAIAESFDRRYVGDGAGEFRRRRRWRWFAV
jgi:hypothetical protein